MSYNYYAIGCCKIEDYELESFKLFEAGIVSLEELEAEEDCDIEFKFYTNSKDERDSIVAQFPHLNFECGEEEARDWDLWWRERQTPVKVSESLWVRPPWVNFSAPSTDGIVLALEAKTAFGTGEHNSTALAAQLMEKVCFKNKSVLDIGTGTGILSLFALKRGAKFSVQTEIDPLTISCVVENFEQNGERPPNAVLGFLNSFNENAKFNVVLCNMIRTEVLPMKADIERLLAQGGEFILSGQLECEKHFILDWFKEAKFTVREEIACEEWWAVLSGLGNRALKLYFDSNCPVCRSFAKLLQKHLGGEIETIPLPEGEQTQEFKLELSNGETVHGKEAIEALEKNVPKIKDFFWMLPESYRGKAVHKTYAFGRFLRRAFNFLNGRQCDECN